MEGGKKWNIEEYRTKYESEEHWNLKKEFLLAHKDKFKKERLICLAQVFVNVQLMRCKYPDPVMRQVAELSKGIGVDYKTVQRERLQRTFVKASDAAAAKVQKLKVNYGAAKSDDNETKLKSSSSQVDCETLSGGAIEEPTKNKNKNKKANKKSVGNLNEVSNDVSKEKGKQSQTNCDIVSGDAIEEPPEKKSKKLDNDAIKVSDTENFLSKMKIILSQTEKNNSESNISFEKPTKWKKIVFTESEDEIQLKVVNKYSKALKEKPDTCLTSFISPKIASISLKSKERLDYSQPKSVYEEECFDPRDLYRSNIFLVSRNFAKFRHPFQIVQGGLEFSKLVMNTAYKPCNNGKEKCLLTTKVDNQVLNLGEAIDIDRKCGKDKASINAVENLLKKCFTVEIKKRAHNDDGEISISSLNPQNKKNEKKSEQNSQCIGSDNVGAKMLKLMGWSGGGLGKKEDGIKEPISVTTPIGRSGLGVKNENAATPIFRSKVKEVLDEMGRKVFNSVDNVVDDVVFSPELSNIQRKHIHLFVRKNYRQLNTVSYGIDPHRYLVIRPKLDHKKLVRYVLSQGGSTEKYEVHKPGTLTVDFFYPQE